MRVHIDDERCRGHGMCCTVCPQVFELTEDGYAVVRMLDIPPELRDGAQAAVKQCPERAITITSTEDA